MSRKTQCLIAKCMAVNPADRPSLQEIKDDPIFDCCKNFWTVVLDSGRQEQFKNLAPVSGKMAQKYMHKNPEDIFGHVLQKTIRNY